MSKAETDVLLARSISPGAVRIVGKYTVPRTYGVYRVAGVRLKIREYRFGNHPARQRDLARFHGAAQLEALFESRDNAEQLARLLNRD